MRYLLSGFADELVKTAGKGKVLRAALKSLPGRPEPTREGMSALDKLLLAGSMAGFGGVSMHLKNKWDRDYAHRHGTGEGVPKAPAPPPPPKVKAPRMTAHSRASTPKPPPPKTTKPKVAR